ncbi:MAG: type IX secretion system sortase PorU [Bacteroidia bacterium]|nr:type IX secretion system sortase PorU [Bacteroidia bacterium]
MNKRLLHIILFFVLVAPLLSFSQDYANESVLHQGTWYKIGITKDGVYKLDFSFLSQHGINPSGIDPRKIQIFGNGGRMLPQENSRFRYDDLVENAIFVSGEDDGVFNNADFIQFYAESAHTWYYSPDVQRFSHQYHLYADTNFYFLRIGSQNGKRVQNIPSESNATFSVEKTRNVHFREIDSENPIRSGRFWLGEKFDLTLERTYGFYIPDAHNSGSVRVTLDLAARSDVGTSFQVYAGSTLLGSVGLSSTNVTNSEVRYYHSKTQTFPVSPNLVGNDDSLKIKLVFNKSGSNRSEGWLDWMETEYDQAPDAGNRSQWEFRLADQVGSGQVAAFSIANGNANYKIWDITEPVAAIGQEYSLTGNVMTFSVNADSAKRFIAFTNEGFTPASIKTIPNQNLHGLPLADYLIITYPEWKTEAERLADFHRNHYQRSVLVVTPQEIYNEFSSGKQDVTAIRDFIRMFYVKSSGLSPGFVLLFGDGTYNYKNINRLDETVVNFIPTYQSRDSWEPTNSYTSDDFYGLLGEEDGFWGEASGVEGDINYQVNLLDVAVGRLPVENKDQAKEIVDKIIRYVTNPNGNGLGQWRNKVVLVADHKEGEGSTHVGQANSYTSQINTANSCINIDKLYMDNYQLVKTAGVTRFPDGRAALLAALDQGSLIVNYTGHGGEFAWSNSRILEIPDIESMQNQDRLPVVVTATCEFGRFDDPELRSGAEIMTMNAETGAIALFTTVRLVYSSPNATLNQNFYRNVFTFDSLQGRMPTLGEVMARTKNSTFTRGNLANINSRNFTLLGDPGLILNYPALKAQITSINDEPVQAGVVDSLQSLSKVKVKGVITDEYGTFQQDYQGEMDVTVFDKPSLFTTRLSQYSFYWQKNRIFNGRATVTDGEFEFEFVVPIDISYEEGSGKISVYFFNDSIDGTGCYDDMYIGGTDPNAVADDKGPEIELFINDDSWLPGGITDANPYLFAKVRDESGINTVGIGIGHEITAELDSNSANVFILNDYYTAKPNSYQEGTVRFQLRDLENGRHDLQVRVWDVANNASEAYTWFIVTDDAVMALEQIFNYPNPFDESTEFVIGHNQAGKNLSIAVEIFSTSGQKVTTLTGDFTASGNFYRELKWDGTTENGAPLSNGVYIYRVILTDTDSGKTISEAKRLVILK